jgi:general secretion pathway protein E
MNTLPLTAADIDAARQQAWQEGRRLLPVLQERCGLAAADFVGMLGELFAWPVLTMSELQAAEGAFDRLSFTDCQQRNGVLQRDADQRFRLVFTDPFDAGLLGWAEHVAPEDCTFCLAHPDDVQAWLTQQEVRLRAIQNDDAPGTVAYVPDDDVQDISLLRIREQDSPVVKLVDSTLYDALKLEASDIHLECDNNSMAVKYRIDGLLVPVTQVQGLDTAEQVISRIKVMANLDIAERRVPQDGRFKVRVNGREIDFRVSIMPNIFGEDAVLRLLDRQSLTEAALELRLENLGFEGTVLRQIRQLSARPHGMLLVTGPTGSGKTTTLYAAITEINTGQDKIITIEDPVEYRLPRVLQIPVNEKKGLTFARGLRSILRHDPDKIMVGEIRDDETAQIAVQSALTGHLVFTTVHANNVFDVLGRFLHMGVDPYSFAAALNGVVSQRLLRLNCDHCAADYIPDDDELALASLTREQVSGWQFRKGGGCGQCRGTGYKGRQALAEVLILDDELRELIAAKAPLGRLKEHAARRGMLPLRDDALRLAASGRSTLAEVSRVAG